MYIVHMWVGKGNGFRVHGLIKEGVIFCLSVFFTLVHSLSSLLRQRLVAQAGGRECICTDIQTLGLHTIACTHIL